jgi:YVTN family beta-propeller protein
VDVQTTAVGASGATCVSAGPDNVLSTTPTGDDVVAGTSIGPGPNGVCATAAFIDTQAQQVGVSQRLLHGFDDWEKVNLAVPAVAGPGSRPPFHDELTFEEAEAIQQMWDQALSPDQTVPLGALPEDTNDAALGVAVVGDRVYATHSRRGLFGPLATQPGELVVFDRKSLAEIARVTVGFDSRAVAVNPNTARAYVVNRQSQTLSVVDTNTFDVVATIPIGLSPIDVEVNTSTNRIYVGNHVTGLLVVDGATNTIVQTVQLGRGALGMAVDEASGTIYLTMNNQGIPPLTNSLNVLVDDGQQVTLRGNVTIGTGPSQPIDVAVDPARQRAYVANLGSSAAPPSVTVLDTATLQNVANVPLTGAARAVALDAEAGRLIVPTDSGVRIVDTVELVEVRHIPAGFGPMAVAVPAGAHRELFTTNRAGQLVRRSYSSGTPTAAAGPS